MVGKSFRTQVYILAGFALLASAIALVKRPWCDEAWFFDPIYNFFKHGTTGTTILESAAMPWSGLERYMYWQGPLYFVILGIWCKLFGQHLFVIRSLSILCGMGALVAWYHVLRGLGMERRAALLAFFLIACDYGYITNSTNGRMDMMSALFGTAGLAVYLHYRERRFSLAVLGSQIFLMLSLLTHPVGAFLNLLAILIIFVLYDRKKLRPSHAALAALPYLVGFACWGIYISKDPKLFFKVFGGNASGRLDGLRSPLLALKREILDRYLGAYGLRQSVAGGISRLKLVIPIILFGGALGALATPQVRSQRPYKLLLILTGAAFLALTFQDNLKFGNYLVHVFPYFLALLAGWAYWAWTARAIPRPLLGTFLAGFVSLQLAGAVYWIASRSYERQYMPVVTYLRKTTSPRQLIMGPAELAFEFGFDANITDDVYLGYHTGRQPDVIVIDPRYQSWFDAFRQKEAAVYRFVRTRLDTEYRRVAEYYPYSVYVRANTY